MIAELSIVIPTYNEVCVSLVEVLQLQASRVAGLAYEVIVADDGSTDPSVVAVNRRINALPHCRYVERGENGGRAVVRNYLVGEACYSWLLFIDSRMRVRDDSFLSTYLKYDDMDVVYGSYAVEEAPSLRRNLRYLYESRFLRSHPASVRQRRPYHDFHTSNFLIRRAVAEECRFDERFRGYGYEDVLFGGQLESGGFHVLHIDNPVVFGSFDANARYVRKTEEALDTLFAYRADLAPYSRMIQLTDRLRRYGLLWLVKLSYRLFGSCWRRKCAGDRPGLRVFDLYRLGYFCSRK